MRQWMRSHLTYANVMATVAVFLVLSGGTAVALSGTNTVQSDDLGPGAQVKAADVATGAVGSAAVTNDSLTGADISEATLTGDARKLVYEASATDDSATDPPKKTLGTVGGYTIKGQCGKSPIFGGMDGYARIYVNGPAGTANTFWSENENDTTDRGPHSTGLQVPANFDLQIASIEVSSGTGQGSPDYERGAGTALLKSGSTLVQLDFHAVADLRSGGSCFIYATATRAT